LGLGRRRAGGRRLLEGCWMDIIIIIIHTSWMEYDALLILEWKFGNLVLDLDVWPNTRPRCMHLAMEVKPYHTSRIPKNLPFVIRVNS
jgi:hypothetical protein